MLAIRSPGGDGFALRRGFDGLGKRAGKIGIKINNSPDIVIELSDQPNISIKIVGNSRLMVLIDLVDEQSILI